MTVLDEAPAKGVAPGAAALAGPRRVRGADASAARLSRYSGLGLGTAVLWLSLVVLIPLAAVVAKSFDGGWGGFWTAVTQPAAVSSLQLTVASSLIVAAINAVMGTLIAWVLVRDSFPGKRIVEFVIDIPFALPTIVAGVVLLSVYGSNSPVGIDLLGTRRAIVFALLFVTLPFVVRTVQPVLMAIDTEAEQAAACLGAPPRTIFRRVVLPLLVPAIASGAALAFARAMGEYGSVLLISGGVDSTRVSSMYAYGLYESYNYQGAAATATVLLAVSLIVIIALDIVQRRVARRG